MIRYNDFTERFFDADGNIVHPREIIEKLESMRYEGLRVLVVMILTAGMCGVLTHFSAQDARREAFRVGYETAGREALKQGCDFRNHVSNEQGYIMWSPDEIDSVLGAREK